MTENPVDDACDCKIGRQQERYDLTELNDRLVDRRQHKEASLRELAAFVNTQIMAEAIDRAQADIAGDPKSVYEALTDDDVVPERRADVVDQLELVGIDVDELRGDFVSHQTVKKHLLDCLQIDTSREGVQTIDEGRAKIDWVQNYQQTVTENVVDQLVRQRLLSIDDYELTYTTSITCTECNRSYRLDEFLAEQRCACSD